jgi:hypothetical protein
MQSGDRAGDRPTGAREKGRTVKSAQALWAELWNEADADERTILLALAVRRYGAETVLSAIVNGADTSAESYSGGAW